MKSANQYLAAIAALSAVMGCSFICAAQTALSNQATTQPNAQASGVQAGYAKLPLSFEANKGQTDPRVQFLSRGDGYSVFLTSGGMVLSLRPTNSTLAAPSGTASSTAAAGNTATSTTPQKTATGDMTMIFNLVGAATNPMVVGEG